MYWALFNFIELSITWHYQLLEWRGNLAPPALFQDKVTRKALELTGNAWNMELNGDTDAISEKAKVVEVPTETNFPTPPKHAPSPPQKHLLLKINCL